MRWILDRILERTGHGFLIPFVNGLSHLGRPSEFLLPPELIGQGLSVFLSGLNNTMAVQSNPDWIWPYWVERQSDPDSPDFQPTALNVIKGNLTHRNWTSLGLPDSAKECMIDPVGMLTLHAFGWSVFPYVRWEGELFCPPRLEGRVRQSLRKGILPCVITEYSAVPGLEWSSETLAVDIEGEELVRFTHTLRNRTGRSLGVVFGLALRPYNALTIGHINRMSCGLPVVAYDCKGPRDIIEPGRSGFLVEFPEEMAKHVAQIRRDPALRERLRIGALRRARDFAPDPILRGLLRDLGLEFDSNAEFARPSVPVTSRLIPVP